VAIDTTTYISGIWVWKKRLLNSQDKPHTPWEKSGIIQIHNKEEFMESLHRCIRTLPHIPPHYSSSLTFSSDGKTLLSVDDSHHTANLWDVNTGELKTTLTGLTGLSRIPWISLFSLDGKTLVAYRDLSKSLKILDVETGELKNSLTGDSSSFYFLAVSPNGKTLAVQEIIQETSYIKLWDISTGELRSHIAPEGFNIRQDEPQNAVFSPNGKTLAIVTADVPGVWCSNRKETVTVWDVSTGQLISSLDVTNSFHPSSKIVFSHDGNNVFISHNIRTAHTVYSSGGSIDASGESSMTILWDFNTGASKKFRSGHICALIPERQIFVEQLQDEPHPPTPSPRAGRGRKRGVSISAKSSHHPSTVQRRQILFVGLQSEYGPSGHGLSGRSNYINIVDIETGQEIKSFPGYAAALSPDGKTLAVGGDPIATTRPDSNMEAVQLLDWSTGVSIANIPGPVRTFTFSPDGQILAVGRETIKLWQSSTEPIVKQPLHGDANPHLNRLENLLAAELWEDADGEMADIIKRFPSQNINAIDQLWVHYSNGYYGFSVQKQIWEKVLENPEQRISLNNGTLNNWEEFNFRVGWGMVDSRPYLDTDNDEYFRDDYRKTTKAYYPRKVYPDNLDKFLELLSRLQG
jgi:WD40 repeat protein